MGQDNPSDNTGNKGATPDLLTVGQAADYLHLSPSSIRSYIRQGRLKAFRVAGLRKVLIARTELLALLEPTVSTWRSAAAPKDVPSEPSNCRTV